MSLQKANSEPVKVAKAAEDWLCPSAPPEWPGANVIGVVGGNVRSPTILPLERAIPVSAEILSLASPVSPTEVFRFSATCIRNGCAQFRRNTCQLGRKLVEFSPAVSDRLPFCTIRAQCRWFHEQGKQACLRCPQVVTDNVLPDGRMRLAADPNVL